MGLGNTKVIQALIPAYGFRIGLHIDLFDIGEMFHIQDLIKNLSVESQNDSLFSNVFMSANVEGIIQHAS